MSQSSLPYTTTELAGVGGQLRTTAEFFMVEEVPLYEPLDEGGHLYINLTKAGLTTREVVARLESLLRVGRGEVGYAGLKDKHALTTQTFSVPMSLNRGETASPQELIDGRVKRIEEAVGVKVNWARLHRNKLKPGHLLGNRFRITLTNLAAPLAEAMQRTTLICDQIRQRGIPNYFGVQRFGVNGENVRHGHEVLLGQRRIHDSWLRKFVLTAYQSQLCNDYLARRVERGLFDQILLGDVAKKHSTGGMFDVADLAADQPRYAAHEISFTAPMFGSKMRQASESAALLEQEILTEAGISDEQWRRVRVEGTRRLGRLLIPDLAVHTENGATNEERLVVEFFLPKGAFATTVLREIMKVDTSNADLPEESNSAETFEFEE